MEEKIALLATHKAFFDAYDAQFCKNFHHFQKVLIIPDDENENEKNQPINDD
ncbi:MAG: hypothetical protein HOE78_06755, partial [Gammaproteobacteria bacterium]|nr:hypothetical protein [Gammaproteobacteria bacterium]